jgi:hypothetical protein
MYDFAKLKVALHLKPRARGDVCLLCLGMEPFQPRPVKVIRELAVRAGVRDARRWNISDILSDLPMFAILVEEGWELTQAGRERTRTMAFEGEQGLIAAPTRLPFRAVGPAVPPLSADPIDLFYCYSHKDEGLRNELQAHLAILKRLGLIRQWHDRRITGGKDYEDVIDDNLERAGVILLLVSSDFLESDYCYDREMARALQRHDTGEARVVPVILRPVDWRGAPFGRLQALPKDAHPVTMWHNRDEAFRNVASGIRAVIEELRGIATSA